MTIDIDPVIFRIGHFGIGWYGLIVGTALVIGVWLALREAERKGLRRADVESLSFWVIAGGISGARLLHVIDRWDLYAADPVSVIAIWNGGLAILGAVLGGMIAGVVVAWRRRLPIRVLSDAAAPAVILGQAIGRFA